VRGENTVDHVQEREEQEAEEHRRRNRGMREMATGVVIPSDVTRAD
jgi:hypothetical protein